MIRFLPPDEWHRVKPTELGTLIPFAEPQNTAIIVAEDRGEIVGTLAAMQVTHLEGLWVKPEYRGAFTAFKLYQQALALARARKEAWVLGGAADDDRYMEGLIRRLGGSPLPVTFYAMKSGGV